MLSGIKNEDSLKYLFFKHEFVLNHSNYSNSRFQKGMEVIMNGKHVILLTSENTKNNRRIYKTGNKIKAFLVALVMALACSCVPSNIVPNSTVIEVEAASKKTTEKKTVKKSRKKASNKTAFKDAKNKKKVKKTSTRKKASSKKSSKKKNSKKSRKKKSSKSNYDVMSTPSRNSFKSYMSYRAVSSSSAQGRLQTKAKTDSDTGIRKVDGRYCVALGSYYCSKIGTKFDLVMSNGSVVKCILADQKANKDTDAKNQKTSDGSIAEFLVDMSQIPRKAKVMGDMSYATKELKGNISKIRVYKD